MNTKKWLQVSTILTMISLLPLVFLIVTLDGHSDSLKFYLTWYSGFIIFLISLIWFFSKRIVLLIVGGIFLFLGTSILFRFFGEFAPVFGFLSFYMFGSINYIPLILNGLILIFLFYKRK